MIFRTLPFAAGIACLASCSSLTRVEVAKVPQVCEIHKVPMKEIPMPTNGYKGIDENGPHAETIPYDNASEKHFPHVGLNLPSCCGSHGGDLYWICPECVKAETAWIRRHPRLTYPEYGTPDPRL